MWVGGREGKRKGEREDRMLTVLLCSREAYIMPAQF